MDSENIPLPNKRQLRHPVALMLLLGCSPALQRTHDTPVSLYHPCTQVCKNAELECENKEVHKKVGYVKAKMHLYPGRLKKCIA